MVDSCPGQRQPAAEWEAVMASLAEKRMVVAPAAVQEVLAAVEWQLRMA